jgi:hypothetical protein
MGLDCPHCTKSIDGWVPEDRLKKATADKREAQTAAAEAAKVLEELTGRAEGAEGLQAELEKVRAELAQVTTTHASQVEVMRHGVADPDDVADLLAIYQRRATEGSTLGEWLADKDALPRSVSALLGGSQPTPAPAPVPASTEAPAAEAAEAAPAAAPATNGVPLPAANAGAVPTPPTNAIPNAKEIAAMSTEQYKAHRDRLLASLTG